MTPSSRRARNAAYRACGVRACVCTIELFYDDVKVKKNDAAAAFDVIKAAAKKRKREQKAEKLFL